MFLIHKIKNFDLESSIQSLKNYIKKEDWFILITTFIFGFLNFYFFLNHTVLSPDGLTYGPLYKSGRWEFQLGRPLLAIIDRLRGGLVSPPIIMFFSLLFISISVMMLRRIFPIKRKLPLFILSLLFVLFPTLSNVALYIYCFDGYCLALLFSILALYFLKNKKYLLSIPFIISSLSLYQAFISIPITGVLLLFILDVIEHKESIKELVYQMLTIFISLVLYFILLKIGMFLFDLSLADYKGASAFGLNTILSIPNSILNAYKDYYGFFASDIILYNHYYPRNIINLILWGLFFGSMIPSLRTLKPQKIALIVCSLLLLPLTTCVMDLIACQTRIELNTAIGFSMTYLFFLIVYDRYSISLFKSLSFVSLLVLFYTYLLSNNGTFQVRVDLYNHYYANSLSILNRVKSLEDYNPDYPWMFNNTIDYTSPVKSASNDDSANSLETFYGYLGVKENEIFYKRFLGEKIWVIEEDQYNEMKKNEEYKQMKKGDIKIIDHIIVVKVSDEDI